MRALDNGNFACGIFVDPQKPLILLITKTLNHYGVRRISNKWLESHSPNQKKFVSINFNLNIATITCDALKRSVYT